MHAAHSGFETKDVVACRDYIYQHTGTHRFDPAARGNFDSFEHQGSDLGHISVNRMALHCGEGFTVRKQGRAPYYSFQFILDGSCQVEASDQRFHATVGDVFILSPTDVAREDWAGRCSQFVVRVSVEDVEKALGQRLGRRPGDIRFKPVHRDPGIAKWLDKVQQSLAGDEHGLFSDTGVNHHMEQSLLMMILTGLEHNASLDLRGGENGLAPYYVRRVERFFHANFGEDITMEDVVTAAGVSVRTVFYGFQRWRGTTPMNYLRDLRLDHARKELSDHHDIPNAVSAAAISAGFTNFGQFSKLYRSRFGEKPSMTVMRARN